MGHDDMAVVDKTSIDLILGIKVSFGVRAMCTLGLLMRLSNKPAFECRVTKT